MARFTAKELSAAGLIASVYAILSLVLAPISFAVYQVRVAEALTVLPFLTRAAIPGLYIGCLLANIIGGMGWLDIVFGPLITLAAAFLTRSTYHLSRHRGSSLFAVLPVVLLWTGAVYLLSGLAVTTYTLIGAGLSALSLVVVALAEKLRARPGGLSSVLHVLSFVGAIASIAFLQVTDDTWLKAVGGFALVASWLAVLVLARVSYSGGNPNLLIAPLPPVLLNAFGVSAYLAPLIGVNYWFSVQMVGVGQLIACYLIGVPLLMALKRRNILG
ncbi:MAG: QueT transporter family protein [candidate division Zixibacteria bacterium]|nr:QueT transporter family protein [candidate division Zixibacteria bacterium]